MTNKEIQSRLTELTSNLSPEEFIYDFLAVYGISKTSITRLRKGDFNLSKVDGEVLYKGKIFFTRSESTSLLYDAEQYAKEERVLKQNPRFIIITDFRTLVAKDLKKGNNRDFEINELSKYFDFFLPLTGAEVYKSPNDDRADRDAAYKLAQLYDILVTDNPDYRTDSHQLNLFLSRLLFCFFAEDTGIFNKNAIFTETLSLHTANDGSNVHTFLDELFQRLNVETGDFPDYLKGFEYVNGGLFKDHVTPPKFSTKSRALLIQCGDLDWSEINPDIFGSMIQAVADPKERSDLGMHYTSVPNILKLIKPLFLDELREEFEANRGNAKALLKLRIRISKIKFFDPACGSGNFLIITYKEIRTLEIEIIKQLIELDAKEGKYLIYFTSIRLSQFYGIEIKDFAHEIAVLSLWLAEHQMNQVFDSRLEGYGQSKPILPLKEAGNIVCANAARKDWEEVCPKLDWDEIYIMGNPPYLGARVQEADQKQDMDRVFASFNKYRDLDYISIWFYKAKIYIEGSHSKFAFVSTNSICQGQQIGLLWPSLLASSIEIHFAYTSFKWINNAKGNAGVTVVILGMRNTSHTPKFIFTQSIKREAKNISPYLIDYPNIIVLERSKPLSNFPKMNFGNMPNDGGGLIFSEAGYQEIISNYPESRKIIRPLIGSQEFLNGNRRYCAWIDDSDLDFALSVPQIAAGIEKAKDHRIDSKDTGTNLLAERSHQFRDRNCSIQNSFLVPRHSSEKREYIPIGFFDENTIIADSAMAIYDAEPWLFGILHSKMHMVWVDTVGGKLKTDYRYSAKLCYNTFPFPDISLKQKESITLYVMDVLEEREKYPEKTMAWLYDPETMPNGLRKAHHELDLAIERIYKLAPFSSDVERLEHLFKLYEEMIAKGTLFEKQKKIRVKK